MNIINLIRGTRANRRYKRAAKANLKMADVYLTYIRNNW